jgi:hypothetical protein
MATFTLIVAFTGFAVGKGGHVGGAGVIHRDAIARLDVADGAFGHKPKVDRVKTICIGGAALVTKVSFLMTIGSLRVGTFSIVVAVGGIFQRAAKNR